MGGVKRKSEGARKEGEAEHLSSTPLKEVEPSPSATSASSSAVKRKRPRSDATMESVSLCSHFPGTFLSTFLGSEQGTADPEESCLLQNGFPPMLAWDPYHLTISATIDLYGNTNFVGIFWPGYYDFLYIHVFGWLFQCVCIIVRASAFLQLETLPFCSCTRAIIISSNTLRKSIVQEWEKKETNCLVGFVFSLLNDESFFEEGILHFCLLQERWYYFECTFTLVAKVMNWCQMNWNKINLQSNRIY